MAGKKNKKKRFQQINRPKVQQTTADLTQPQNPSTGINLASPITKPTSSAKVTPSGKGGSAASKAVSYEFFTSDLKRIGILTAIIIVVLIILGIVLK
jgi:hypothetical protein